MSVRDLGYRAYEGERLPASQNTWVMLRHSLSRAWSSWLVKIAVFLAVGPLLLVGAMYAFNIFVVAQAIHVDPTTIDAGKGVRQLFGWETWLFVLMVTLGAGAPAIAEDLQHKAFQFFFAKPVTAPQYLFGRIGATAIFAFGVTFVPALFLVLFEVLVGAPTTDLKLERLALLLPSLLDAVLVSLVTSTIAVALSSLSKSRALTMSAWILLFFVPHVLAGLVSLLGHWDWLYLASVPGVLGILGDALFKQTGEHDAVKWFHAAPVAALFVGGAVWLALERLRRAEVIT